MRQNFRLYCLYTFKLSCEEKFLKKSHQRFLNHVCDELVSKFALESGSYMPSFPGKSFSEKITCCSNGKILKSRKGHRLWKPCFEFTTRKYLFLYLVNPRCRGSSVEKGRTGGPEGVTSSDFFKTRSSTSRDTKIDFFMSLDLFRQGPVLGLVFSG